MATISNLTPASRSNGFTASGTLDGVQFNSIKVGDGQGLETKWNRADGPWKTAGSTELNSFAVNAVDIDWNGAYIGDISINSTGQLLNYIKERTGDNLLDTIANIITNNSVIDSSITQISITKENNMLRIEPAN